MIILQTKLYEELKFQMYTSAIDAEVKRNKAEIELTKENGPIDKWVLTNFLNYDNEWRIAVFKYNRLLELRTNNDIELKD